MAIGKDLALRIPRLKRVWDERVQAIDRQAALQDEIRSLKQEISIEHGQWRLSPFAHYDAAFDPLALIRKFEKTDRSSHPTYLTNFLGVRVDPDMFGGILPDAHGVVEPLPIPANWHADIAEWGAALLAVDEAQGVFRMVELGCGWACWLVNLGSAARDRGLSVDLIGIEADGQHLSTAFATMAINGFGPGDFQLTRGVAAPYNGQALFPNIDRPAEFWDTAPIFNPTDDQIRAAGETKSHDILPAVPLTDLCRGKPIDLLHVDIQGGEVDFVEQNFGEIQRFVKRLLIGTHSRAIEGRLMQFLQDAGWAVEMDRPALTSIQDGRPMVRVDGVHLYRNRQLG
ncbi:class I SAM-dependent methyltransferase [Antarcticirhabdus aurantiaca]|uniref:Class I SAM-dependent methyltransferase n=1 Tax=Antarcticirhabdus aurantiaca TaxID=2606717 RepID=A0ACD4NT77_9HYPH|nr:class I SAM-dependent methyltransferase [Antarcticirhabdus aurantiaca]WAJ29953.1 class I SAM-dependent methyltransferase [Jeongeuplla avenae]